MQIHLNAILQYPHVWTPRPPQQGGNPKYSALFLLDEDAAREAWAAIHGLMEANFPGRQVPHPLRNCTEKLNPGAGFIDGRYFMNASSNNPPFLCDTASQIADASDARASFFYAGAKVDALIDFYVQKNHPRRYPDRINCGLQGIQFIEHGEPLEGGAPAITGGDFNLKGDPSGAAVAPSIGAAPANAGNGGAPPMPGSSASAERDSPNTSGVNGWKLPF